MRLPQHDGYAANVVAKIADVTLRQIRYWDETDFLVPTVSRQLGNTHKRLYSFADIVALRTIGELRKAGVSLQGLRAVADYLRKRQPPASFADTWLASDGIDVYERIGEGQEISVLKRPGQYVLAWAIDLGHVAQEVDKAIRTLKTAA